jgi:hypothetical protein
MGAMLARRYRRAKCCIARTNNNDIEFLFTHNQRPSPQIP